ncbi:SCO2521 family protein [Sphaerisporangium dianthi]|uniref:SCO2521 family protein n=1 Tax=Sphaerisporangium dianthi TaxID=1436120 RepID=A0ABV9CQF5_9ACTN
MSSCEPEVLPAWVPEDHVLMMGEVRTGLLQNTVQISLPACEDVLNLMAGERVLTSRRPIPRADSPDVLTGVDCALATASGARVRGVGTVVSHAAITGGRVLQTSSYARLAPSAVNRRMPWSHYLATPGVVEVLGRPRWADLAAGFSAPAVPHGRLDFGAISERLMDAVQASPHLDRQAPFRAARTRLRWVIATKEEDALDIHLVLVNDTVRTLRLAGDPANAVVAFCEDLALHDWLLTTVDALTERAFIGSAPPAEVAARLAPAIDHLLHLWMPAARMDDSVLHFWEQLERKPGFGRQWRSSVDRIRDQVASNTLSLLSLMARDRRDSDERKSPRRAECGGNVKSPP